MLECVHVHIGTNKNSNITQFYTRLAKIKVSSICSLSIKVTKNCLLDYERNTTFFALRKKSREPNVDSLNK